MLKTRSGKRILSLGLAASSLILSDYALAANDIDIIPAQNQVDLDELGIFTLRFDVENRTGDTQELKERIHLPDGWQILTESSSFLLTNGSRESRLVHLVAPRGASAGLYNVQYQIYSINNGSLFSQQTIRVRIVEQSDLKLTTLQTPKNLLPGENFDITFLLENSGNKQTRFFINAKDEDGFIRSVSPKKVMLNPGDNKPITVSGKIPETVN